MYIYYVYTTKSIGSKSVTLLLLLLRKKKQRYKIPSQSARDLKRHSENEINYDNVLVIIYENYLYVDGIHFQHLELLYHFQFL